MSRPSILVLSLMEEKYLYSLFEPLMSSMRAVATVKLVTRAGVARTILSSDTPPTAVLAIDSGPTHPKYAALNNQLVHFAEAGGTVVFGCNFSNNFAFTRAGAFFRAWSVPWDLGHYHSTEVHLNKKDVLGLDLAGLEPSYWLKAVNLVNVPPKLAVYNPLLYAESDSEDGHAPPSIDTSETPAAYTAVGLGFMGYTGDVNAEAPTTKTIMAMLHLPLYGRRIVSPSNCNPSSLVTIDCRGRNVCLHFLINRCKFGKKYMYPIFEPLMSSMRAVATVKLVTRAGVAKTILSSNTPPTAVLSIDAAPTETKYTALNNQLVRYVEAGGIVVFGCNFSNHLTSKRAGPFFRAWGVPWELGDYHRTTVYLNKNDVLGLDVTGLEPSYSVKALNLAKVLPNLAVYSPSSSSLTESHVFAPTSVDASQTPAAYTAFAAGFMGYTGDVNAEEPTTKIIMAMLHLPVDGVGPKKADRPNVVTTTHRSTARGIPPRVAPTTLRPREAEVEARAARRNAVDRRKREAADKIKEKGNNVFKAGKYQEAVQLYKKACSTYKPLPLYMSNLAAALLKLNRWNEAEIAADHATLVEPTLLKAYFRRGVARRHGGKYNGAIRDFERCLKIDPNCADSKKELAATKKERSAHEVDEVDDDSDYDTKLVFDLGPDFAPERTIHVLDCPSDSEDFRHKGKNKGDKLPCRYYNHDGCRFGNSCRYKHAPDDRSIRDELGRNVCLHFLINRCKFGSGCWYAHEKLYLPSNGWWNEENLGGWQELYDFVKGSMPDGVFDRIGSAMNGTADTWRIRKNLDLLMDDWIDAGGSDQYSDDYDEDDDDDDLYALGTSLGRGGSRRQYEEEMEERERNLGFTDSEVEELLCQGVKPWDDDAWASF
ncbi:hypothetical protein EV360DRAFT_43092 [Lentinula raphanica]|nr:hypothetical protein EV360DRAFT_43092 [Lentinula raphanica]